MLPVRSQKENERYIYTYILCLAVFVLFYCKYSVGKGFWSIQYKNFFFWGGNGNKYNVI